MFYEARRGDKEALSRMKDGVRRAHRRKHFYENVRKGPEQFLHIQGLKATIHTDVTISRAAEAGNILRCWQGDPDVTIDRFDARSLIDHIPEPRKNVEFTSLEEKEEMVCNYERYRLLVLFDFRRDSEKTILHEIAAKERWSEQAEEKKTAFKRKRHENHTQGVQFVYEDSEIVGGGCDNEEEGSDVAEEEGMKHKFDSTTFSYSTEAQKLANSIAEAYGVKNGHFVALVHVDEKAQKDAEELARIDKEKRRQTGPGGNLVRQQLRKQADTIIRRGQSEEATLKLSLLRKEEKQEEKESSSSEEEKAPETEFILSFGGEEEGERRRGKENRKGGSSRKDRRSPSPRRRRSRSTSKHRGRESSPRREGRERRRRRSRSTSRRRRWESPKSEGPERPLFGLFEKKLSPNHVSSDSGEDDDQLEIRSSMSDSEKERIEIENRKRRVKRTKRMVKAKQQAAGKERRQEGEGKTDVEKVKKIMQKSLRKTMEEMKEEEDEKKREHRKEQRVREELNFLAEQERRLRRREKMRQEREGRERSRSCDSTTDRNLFRG